MGRHVPEGECEGASASLIPSERSPPRQLAVLIQSLWQESFERCIESQKSDEQSKFDIGLIDYPHLELRRAFKAMLKERAQGFCMM